jgi:hypothetical protein
MRMRPARPAMNPEIGATSDSPVSRNRESFEPGPGRSLSGWIPIQTPPTRVRMRCWSTTHRSVSSTPSRFTRATNRAVESLSESGTSEGCNPVRASDDAGAAAERESA